MDLCPEGRCWWWSERAAVAARLGAARLGSPVASQLDRSRNIPARIASQPPPSKQADSKCFRTICCRILKPVEKQAGKQELFESCFDSMGGLSKPASTGFELLFSLRFQSYMARECELVTKALDVVPTPQQDLPLDEKHRQIVASLQQEVRDVQRQARQLSEQLKKENLKGRYNSECDTSSRAERRGEVEADCATCVPMEVLFAQAGSI